MKDETESAFEKFLATANWKDVSDFDDRDALNYDVYFNGKGMVDMGDYIEMGISRGTISKVDSGRLRSVILIDDTNSRLPKAAVFKYDPKNRRFNNDGGAKLSLDDFDSFHRLGDLFIDHLFAKL